jgi:pimeloyl-ACP methyl ester carboxylesterase
MLRFITRKRLTVLLLTLALSYVSAILLLMLLENTILYRPKRFMVLGSVLPGVQAQDLWLPSAAGLPIHACWLPCPGARRALLFCHGNTGRHPEVVRLMKGLKISLLLFDYPGYGQSEGRPSEAGCYAAADAAYDWLQGQVAPERIVIAGQSLGGGVAVDLASRRTHGALVLFKTFTSVPDVAEYQCPLLPARWLAQNRFDNLAKIHRCAGPTLIAHGENDHLISLAQARELFAAAREPKSFCLLPGCSHRGSFPGDFFKTLKAFLDEYCPADGER